MSSCLSGGSRAIRIDLDIVKSPSSTSTITSHSTSPSSTLSESSNSPLVISTRKPRTRRKRPNQTYHEAAALLSTAYPNIFSTKNLTKPCKFTKPHETFLDEGAELLLPFRVFDNSGFLLHHPIPEKPTFRIEQRVANCSEKRCQRPEDNEFQANLWNGYQEDFDAESILDEEIEGGIDSIIGNVEVTNDGSVDESSFGSMYNNSGHFSSSSTCYGHPVGLGFGVKLDSCLGNIRRGFRSLRHGDDNCWRFPTVDVSGILPKLNKAAPEEKKKKKTEKQVEAYSSEPVKESPKQENESSIPKSVPGLLLKLNYDNVLNAWSDRGTPFSDDVSGQEMSATGGSDLQARLAQIDLFSESGGLREASVLRYKEKRRTRLFSKKIRYQVRKVNADQRPRMKGRFVRRPNSPMSESRQD